MGCDNLDTCVPILKGKNKKENKGRSQQKKGKGITGQE